jgi:hypothetical protein
MPAWFFASLQGYRIGWLPRDLVAGLMLAAIAIPGQLATARLAGMPPETGLYAFAAGSLAFAAFGANRFMSVAADSTIAPIFAGALSAIAAAGTARYTDLAILLAVLVGIVLLIVGLLGGTTLAAASALGAVAPMRFAQAQTPSTQAKPNILFMLVDNLGYGELGCQGNSQIPTPQIDSLATSGVRFLQGYITAPVCTPSRAGLLTGRGIPAQYQAINDSRGNCIARVQGTGGGSDLLLYGHLDATFTARGPAGERTLPTAGFFQGLSAKGRRQGCREGIHDLEQSLLSLEEIYCALLSRSGPRS